MLAAALFVVTASASIHRDPSPTTCDGHAVKAHVQRAHELLRKAYADSLDMPVKALVEKAQAHKLCVHIANVRDGLADYRAEQKQGWLNRMKPFVGPDGRHWSIPWANVQCESNGNYTVGYAGAYGMTSPAWNEWGGPALSGSATAGGAAPIYQDITAARGWAKYGSSAWDPYEGGCA